MEDEIENLYQVFQRYRITIALNHVGVFDFGPSESELKGISKPLKEIPEDVLLSMEFYGYGWSSWGTEEEVKYYLPRLLGLFSKKLEALEHVFSLLKFKLNDALLPESDWPKHEVKALRDYFISLLKCNITQDIGYLIEGLVVVGFSAEEVLGVLRESEPLSQKICAEKILAHFDVASKTNPANPVYVDTRIEDIQIICDWAYEFTTSNM
jgi:hypothetical protein